jgi:hypothetical protein
MSELESIRDRYLICMKGNQIRLSRLDAMKFCLIDCLFALLLLQEVSISRIIRPDYPSLTLIDYPSLRK